MLASMWWTKILNNDHENWMNWMWTKGNASLHRSNLDIVSWLILWLTTSKCHVVRCPGSWPRWRSRCQMGNITTADHTFLARLHVSLHIVHGTIGTQTEATRQFLATFPTFVISVEILIAELSTTGAHLSLFEFTRFLDDRFDLSQTQCWVVGEGVGEERLCAGLGGVVRLGCLHGVGWSSGCSGGCGRFVVVAGTKALVAHFHFGLQQTLHIVEGVSVDLASCWIRWIPAQ